MARIDALPSIDIILGLKKVLDFYLWRGLPCVRAWPRYRPANQTAASKASAHLFGDIIKGYNLLGEGPLTAFRLAAADQHRSSRDIYVSAVLGHLHERTPPVPPSVKFTVWSPDAPPAAPSALDDEFDDATFDTVLWTEFDPGSILVVTEPETGLVLIEVTNPGDDVCGIYQPVPAGDFTITAKLALLSLEANFSSINLALWHDAANAAEDIYTWGITYRVADQSLDLIHWTNHTTYDAGIYAKADNVIATALFFRIRRIGTTFYFDWSTDGLAWHQCHAGALLFAPAHFGITINNVATGLAIRGVATFFRYTPDGTLAPILHGDRISQTRDH